MSWDLCTVLTLALLNIFLAQLANSMVHGSPSTMVEGDMAVPEQQGRQNGLPNSFVIANDSLWAGGLVPFRFEKLELVGGDFEDLFRDEDMIMIRSVLDGITEAVPCVRFREVPDSHTEHCLIFTVIGDSGHPAQGCWSFPGNVGPQGGKTGQSLNLGQNCMHRGIVLHEVMHALGATHEQNRKDRDLFIRINHKNIMDNARHNFQKKTEGFNSRGTPYDYESIMHYKATDFSKNGKATIIPLRRDIILRKKSEMSPIDVVELSKVYEGITSTSCYSTEMLLRYATQLENMISRPSNYACPEYGLNFAGHDIHVYYRGINSWEECARRCHQHKSCSHWTREISTSKCYLKTSDGGAKRDGNYISGVAHSCINYACPEYGLDFDGGDITHHDGINSWEECALLCNQHESCSYWSWAYPRSGQGTKRCWLKNSDEGATNGRHRISGVESCATR